MLGDFAFGPRAKDPAWLAMLFQQLPGARRHLVVGNHDGPATLALPWDSVGHLAEVEDAGAGPGGPGGHAVLPVTLCHYPMLTWPGARKGALQFFGHVHARWLGSRNSVNVGVDLWDFRPVTAREAAARGRARCPSTNTGRTWSHGRH